MVSLFIIGLIIIISSTLIGDFIGNQALQNRGGAMDTSGYSIILDNAIVNFRLVGVLISSFGGIGTMLSGIELFKILDNDH